MKAERPVAVGVVALEAQGFVVSFAMEQWGPEHRAFVVETFFKNGDSITVTQRKFRLHFNVARHGRIPSRNTILLWVHNFHTTASATKKKQGGSARTVRTPVNVEAMRNAVEQSPR